MKNFFFGLLGLLLVVVAGVLYLSLYTVQQHQQAMVLAFGEFIEKVEKPGLHFKKPWHNVEYFDKRVLDFDSARSEEIITSENNRLVVDAFMRYQITNPLLYYQTVKLRYRAHQRLSVSLTSALRRVLGKATRTNIVREDRSALMAEITRIVNADAKKNGMEVVDVRIKRADLPPQNSKSVFLRMQTERQREAAEFRAEGEEKARRIRAKADAEVTVIKANATRDAEKIRGQGDAIRNQIFNKAYGQDPDFFAFYRSMQAYEQGLASSDTRMVMSPDSKFFQYFKDPTGGVRK